MYVAVVYSLGAVDSVGSGDSSSRAVVNYLDTGATAFMSGIRSDFVDTSATLARVRVVGIGAPKIGHRIEMRENSWGFYSWNILVGHADRSGQACSCPSWS